MEAVAEVVAEAEVEAGAEVEAVAEAEVEAVAEAVAEAEVEAEAEEAEAEGEEEKKKKANVEDEAGAGNRLNAVEGRSTSVVDVDAKAEAEKANVDAVEEAKDMADTETGEMTTLLSDKVSDELQADLDRFKDNQYMSGNDVLRSILVLEKDFNKIGKKNPSLVGGTDDNVIEKGYDIINKSYDDINDINYLIVGQINNLLPKLHNKEIKVSKNDSMASIRFAYKKLMNLFVYYIINYNLFKNSFFIKKLQNIRNTSYYKNNKEEINKQLSIPDGPNIITSLDKYLDDNLTTKKYTSLLNKLLLDIDISEERSDEYIKKFHENIKNLLKKEVDIDEINNIIFQYMSERFIMLYEKAGSLDYKEHISDLNLILAFYRIIKVYTHQVIAGLQFIKTAEANVRTTEILERFAGSEVISYVKIRDYKDVYNPRYIYYTDQNGNDDPVNTLSNATLSLLYCNDPTKPIELLKLENFKDNSIVEEKEQLIKYDHLFHYGYFDKIFYNENNSTFGNNMDKVKDKLKMGKDVFVIGYGASGAGKTTTLIFDNNDKDHPDGAIVYMLQKLAGETNDNGDFNFQTLELTINEIFMDDDSNKIGEIKNVQKVTDLKFSFDGKTFSSTPITDDEYKERLKTMPEEEEELKKLHLSITELDRLKDGSFSLSEILQLLIDKKRKVSATSNNPQSSRSHAIGIMKFKNNKDGEYVRLIIGDFAGVENKFDYTFDYKNDFLTRIKKFIPDEVIEKAIKQPEDDREINPKFNLITINEFMRTLYDNKVISQSIYELSNRTRADTKANSQDDNKFFYQADSKWPDTKMMNKMVKYLNRDDIYNNQKYKLDDFNYVIEIGGDVTQIKPTETKKKTEADINLNKGAEEIKEISHEINQEIHNIFPDDAERSPGSEFTFKFHDVVNFGKLFNKNKFINVIKNYILTKTEKNDKIIFISPGSSKLNQELEPQFFFYVDKFTLEVDENKGLRVKNILLNNSAKIKEEFMSHLQLQNETQTGSVNMQRFSKQKKIFTHPDFNDGLDRVLKKYINDSLEKSDINKKILKLEARKSELNIEQTELGVKIKQEIENAQKFTAYYLQILGRVVQIHNELIKRTYEGVFINRSLQSMRSTMTDVLKAKSEGSTLIPNFNSKCTNFYTNPLTNDMFGSKTEDDTSARNKNDKFNTIHEIIAGPEWNTGVKPTIPDMLKNKLIYCVCLVLNNSYEDHEGSKVNNPPKIPYIDLTEGYIELERYKRRSETMTDDPRYHKQIIFKRYGLGIKAKVLDSEGKDEDYLLTPKLRKNITNIIGYDYKKFVAKKLQINIFKNIQDYTVFCYNAAIENQTIASSKLAEIIKNYNNLDELIEFNSSQSGDIIKAIENYLYEIEVMNATSVIGTLDFADQISKYNLKFNACSVVQNNIKYKSSFTDTNYYDATYNYFDKFKKANDSPYGVHLYSSRSDPMFSQWKKYIMPSIKELSANSNIRKKLLFNKNNGPYKLKRERTNEFKGKEDGSPPRKKRQMARGGQKNNGKTEKISVIKLKNPKQTKKLKKLKKPKRTQKTGKKFKSILKSTLKKTNKKL